MDTEEGGETLLVLSDDGDVVVHNDVLPAVALRYLHKIYALLVELLALEGPLQHERVVFY
jgi:hypothetical protein